MAKRRSAKLDDGLTGSPQSGEPVFLAVGKLQRAHGLGGEIVMVVLTDFPERLVKGKKVYVGEDYVPQLIRGVRSHNVGMLIAFEGLDTPELVGALTNQTVYVRSDELPALPEGEYYHHQLLGLTVIDQQGTVLGVLAEILETGANDVYIVEQADGSEMLLPNIMEVILAVDLAEKRLVVKPPEWM